MQGGSLPGPGRATHEEKSVRPGNQALHSGQRVRVETQLIDGNRLGRREHTQYRVFQTVRRGNGCDTQLHSCGAKLAEVDLAVLGLTALRNIEPAHDLDSGDQGITESGGQVKIVHQCSVFAETYARTFMARIGFDVDVRRLLP